MDGLYYDTIAARERQRGRSGSVSKADFKAASHSLVINNHIAFIAQSMYSTACSPFCNNYNSTSPPSRRFHSFNSRFICNYILEQEDYGGLDVTVHRVSQNVEVYTSSPLLLTHPFADHFETYRP